MLVLGFILSCWLGLGLILTLFRFFIYFRNPTHLYNAYMFDKRTKSLMEEVFKSDSIIEEDKAGVYFRISMILAMVFPPIPFILLIHDIKVFSMGYEPFNKQTQNREND